ncbi:hypothetical protein [Phaffia rhodozyma]|uniref:Uncharacterized protein n=1 Tax=Phaffia rhodozyma TaxID=264483 RepID=A0A0F7SF07_PHARH|nr:hypothetical protein [Phaffia rhodozyma]
MEKTPEGYLPIPTSAAPPSYTPQQPSSKLSKTKKLAILASVSGGLFYLASKCGGGHGFPDLWDGDFKKGWEIVKHKGAKHHWEEQAWEWDSSKERGHNRIHHEKLGTSALKLSEPINDEFRPNATVSLTAAESFWLNLEDGVQAELQFVPSKGDAVSFYVEQVLQSSQVDESTLASYDALKVVDDSKNPEKAGLIISRGQNAQSSPSYIISISLPVTGKPFSFHADGNSLAVPAANLKGIKFDAFSLTAGVTDKVELNDLHAREATVDLSFGAIVGSFNVSRELILRTVAGAIQANVTLFEIPHHHHHHKHGKQNGTESEEFPSPPKDGERPPHHPPPHHLPHFPPFVVNVVTTTGVGAIDLQYVGDIPSNHTSLLSKSVARIGEVRVSAPTGYKGKFVEGSRIGEVSVGFVPGVNVTIEKEVHHGPGGFIKGFVGDHPSPHHKHCPDHPKHPKHPKGDKPEKKEAGHPHGRPEDESYGAEKRHHHLHKMHGDDDDDDEEDKHRVHKHHHHHEDDDEEVHDHKHNDEKKPKKGPKKPKDPKGPKKDHRGPPHPPPGYGFVGAFTGTGKTEVFFA